MKCLEIGTQQRIRPVRDGMILDRSTAFFDALINSRYKIKPYPIGTDPLMSSSLAMYCQATITKSLRDKAFRAPNRPFADSPTRPS